MKKIFFVLSLFMALFLPNDSSAAVIGDVNGDGQVSLHEAIYALQIASGVQTDIPSSCLLTIDWVNNPEGWVNGTDYNLCDVVNYSGTFYVTKAAIINSTNDPATDTANWVVLAVKGDQGETDGFTVSDGDATFITGNVGIGTITPQTTLDVNGSIRMRQTDTPSICSSLTAGTMQYSENTTSSTLRFCMKTGENAYEWYLFSASPQYYCGDGVLREGMETCDDGNAINTDSCLDNCTLASCGDGFIQAGIEECDDGNDINTDACSNACTLNSCNDSNFGVQKECTTANEYGTCSGWQTCQGFNDGWSQCNAKVPAQETCNDIDDDCDAQVDEGNVCGFCGDGNVWEGIEECDDGNVINTDACLDDCTLAFCGDGFIRVGIEECDDGNDINTDACSNTCTLSCNVPTITNFDPPLVCNLVINTLSITGSNFDNNSQVSLIDPNLNIIQLTTTFISQESLEAEIPADLPAENYEISISNGIECETTFGGGLLFIDDQLFEGPCTELF